MKNATLLAASVLLSAAANAAPATEASIEELLEASGADAIVNTVYNTMEQMLRQSVQQAVAGRTLSQEQRRSLDTFTVKYSGVLRQELAWPVLRPLYIDVYRESFDQEEVEALIAFYRSPAGRAFVRKMPTAMQRSLTLTQRHVIGMLPRMQQAVRQAVDEVKLAR